MAGQTAERGPVTPSQAAPLDVDPRFNFLFASSPSSSRHIRTTFEHRHPDASGTIAIDYWPAIPSNSPGPSLPRRPEQLHIFILGNPAILEYYTPFLDHLHQRLPASHAILATSHIGHSPGLAVPKKPLHLLQQLEAKVELVSALKEMLEEWTTLDRKLAGPSSTTPSRISLIGHSVGSWLAVETAKRLPGVVESIYMLFPTVGWIADSQNGRTLWPIFTPLIRFILPYLSILLRPILPLTPLPAPTRALVRSPPTISAALYLARTEMDTIRAPDLDFFARSARAGAGPTDHVNESKVYGVWSAGKLDRWVGKEGPMVQDALGREGGGRVRVLDGVPHAFCLSLDNSRLVADVLANWISPGAERDIDEDASSNMGADSAVPM